MPSVDHRLHKLEHASPAQPLRIVWVDTHRADGFEAAERETAELERSGFDVLQVRWLRPGEGKQ